MAEPVAVTPPKKKSRWWIWLVVGLVIFFIISVFLSIGLIVLLSGDLSLGPLEGNKIAIIRLEGVISGSGSGQESLLGAELGVSPEQFRENVKEVLENNSIKAVVIRVNSPGGTPAASQEIYQEIKSLVKKRKVVASISDVAASGAYYSISPIKKIMADPASVVGSIGVYMEIPILKGLYKKLGVDYTIIKAGKYKALGHPNQKLSKEEKAILQKQVNEIYNQFIEDVDKGRKNLDEKDVRKLANGLTYPGSEALKLGLVDELGGYSLAIKKAAKMAKLGEDYEVIEINDGDLFGINNFLNSILRLRLPEEEVKIR